MADGRILVAGSTTVNPYLYALDDYPGTGKLVVARFLEDGKSDTSFAEIGSLTTDLLDLGISAPAAFAVRAGSDGHIFVAGTGLVSGARRGFVLCLRENGEIESTFGSAGLLLAPTTAEESALFALIRHGSAGLVAAGYDFSKASGRDFLLTRLAP
jgi:hypothetical protein